MAVKPLDKKDSAHFSESWLKAYASRNADVIESRRQDSPDDISNLEEVLHELDDKTVPPSPPTPTPDANNEQTPDEKTAPKDISKEPNSERREQLEKQRQQDKADKAQAAHLEKQRKQQRRFTQSVQEEVVSPFLDNVSGLADRVGAIQTVGGVGLLVLILIILVFVVVQVNAQGDTRMKQLWYMLNGRARLVTAVDVVQGSTANQVTGSSGAATGSNPGGGTVTGTPIPTSPTTPTQPVTLSLISNGSPYRRFTGSNF